MLNKNFTRYKDRSKMDELSHYRNTGRLQATAHSLGFYMLFWVTFNVLFSSLDCKGSNGYSKSVNDM